MNYDYYHRINKTYLFNLFNLRYYYQYSDIRLVLPVEHRDYYHILLSRYIFQPLRLKSYDLLEGVIR